METKEKTLLEVQGMTCGSCVAHVSRALRDLAGVTRVEVRLREGKVLVEHDDETEIPTLIAALAEEGYPSRPAAA
jgi:copper chaperone